MSADRFNMNKSFESVQSKFLGTGNADMSKWEWATNQHRDSIASHVSHHDMVSYFALAQGDSTARVRMQLMNKMAKPVGNHPPKKT